MSATINVVCYKNKKLANGESPLMIRISKDRKSKYKSLGVSIDPNNWDFNKNRPKNACPNKDLILKIILDKESEFQKKMLELKADDRDYTASTLLATKAKIKIKSVSEFYNQLIEDMIRDGRIGNSRVYTDSLRSLEAYFGKSLDIPFSDIDVDFLNGYEKWLRQKGYAETSMSVCFRTLRSAYNKAIQDKCTKQSCYPFNDYKTSKFNIKTDKRAISKDEILLIMKTDLSSESNYIQFSRDIFILSYLCGGINFTDIANLTSNNIVDGRLIYIRQKTNRKINIPLGEEAMAIIGKYSSNSLSSGYLFPILNKEVHITETQKYNRRKKVLLKVNRSLKIIADKLDLKVNLSTYVSRHSYATILKNCGVNIALIGETLGHSDLKTTQIYLDSFENSQINDAMKNLL